MKKAERQQKIREIITNESIERQEDLVARLREMGLTVTQATISRDIKEMQLIKIPADNGGYRYGLPAYHLRFRHHDFHNPVHHQGSLAFP